MKLGVVDLDTSHPAAWIPIERELGCEIVGLWDGGTVHPKGYAEKFAAEHNVPRVFDTLEQMVPEVDGVVIHGCDWDTHIAKARPFVEAGKAVIIDKPMAGNLTDLLTLKSWSDNGAKIFGGSTLRYARELTAWLETPVAERGTPHTALSGCAVDVYNYGIHAYTFLLAAMGPGVRSARYLGDGVQQRVELRWEDGRLGWVCVGEQPGGWMPFYATIVTDRGYINIQPDSGQLYRAFLERSMDWFSGKSDKLPCPFDELLQPELSAIAALQSRQQGGREVLLSEISASTAYDGAAFAVSYRKARYPDA